MRNDLIPPEPVGLHKRPDLVALFSAIESGRGPEQSVTESLRRLFSPECSAHFDCACEVRGGSDRAASAADAPYREHRLKAPSENDV